MREILFRGKRKNGGEWVYGFYRSYIYRKKKHAWLETIDRTWEIKPETVGQYTGLIDSAGKKIFEGDIVQFHNTEGREFVKSVNWNDKLCCVFIGNLSYAHLSGSGFFQPSGALFEIIGNLWDSPELLSRE